LEVLEDRSAPAISIVAGTTLPGAAVATAYSEALSAGGGTAPYTWSVIVGALPTGLTLSNTTGTIGGTPTAGGSFSFTVQATDHSTPAVSGTQAYNLTVAAPTISISPTTLASAAVGVSDSQTLTAGGGTGSYSYSWSAASGSSLPPGLTLSSTKGTLSGTPTAPGTFSFTVSAKDSSTGTGPYTGSQSYTLTVGVGITPGSLPSATVGKAYKLNLTAAGGTAPYTWALASGPGLPAGLTLSSAGVLSGTPTAAGSFNFSVKATDSSSTAVTASQKYSFTVSAPTITLKPATLPTAHVGSHYSRKLSASGGTAPYTFTADSLPSGLTLSKRGVLSGTPQKQGTFSITVTATDASKGTGSPFKASLTYTLTVDPGLPSMAALSIALPNVTVNGTLPSFQVTVTDALHNPLKGVTVTLKLITLAALGPAGFGKGSVLSAVTGANGVALFSNLSITGRGVFQIEADAGSAEGHSNLFQVGLAGRSFGG
jgi:hypothetical protein